MDKYHLLAALFLTYTCCLPSLASAEDILPVAQGRYSTTVVLDKSTAPPPTGSWIEFIGEDDKGIPRRIGVVGFVLGISDNAVFIELSESGAARLAHAEEVKRVRFQKFADTDPEAVAERQRHRDDAQPVTLAPRIRTVTVSVDVEEQHVQDWTPGEVLTFPELGEIRWRPSVTGWRARGLDIEAMFVSAKHNGADRYDVTLVAEPRDAFSLLKAAAQNRLSVDPKGEVEPEAEAERRCYIKHRRGTEAEQIAIPCE